MKLKVRSEDADALEMSEWFALLRDKASAEMAGDGGNRPRATAPAPPENRSCANAEIVACAENLGRAVIGDQLRIPIAWCEMGPCISHHSDPAALGEADIRVRALSAGWRVDGLGRLACPDCQQSCPWFWPAQPVAPWDREAALTMVATYLREDDATASTAGAQAAVISAAQPAAIPRAGQRIRGRHRKQP